MALFDLILNTFQSLNIAGFIKSKSQKIINGNNFEYRDVLII
ncbi:hypothetical protein KKC1_02560 [Calderihabitans maritimus]|uniref:Uncharacterized protein n=1 Tax=Calderihabitans maritimus TaxID=1246530 RepID=A0A1Z5HNK4_9FIRM|nr:hypothetical protein KKC1_02560 [Calderihabitans maritimus]